MNWITLLVAAVLPAFAASTIQFQFTNYAADENAPEVVIDIRRTGDLDTTVTADFLTVEGTAKAGEDYSATTGSLSFDPGSTNKTIRIPLLNNASNEPSETFRIQLANPSADTTLGAVATVTIRDNDGMKLEFTAYRAGEGTASVTLALVRGPDEVAPASVDYVTVPGTATAGADFVAANGTAEFQSGERVKLVVIPILNDGLNEPSETFRVNFSNASGGTLLNPASATVTILDNDKGVAFVQNRLWVHEDQEGVRIEVTRGNDALLDPFVVDYTVVNGTAMAGEDFTAGSGSLSFAAGEPTRAIWVPVVNDGIAEADESFKVTLSNPTAGQPPGAITNLTSTVTICDATGMEPHRFRGIYRLADGSIQLNLQGGVHKRFLPYYSIFQLDASADLQQWQPLKLLGYPNSNTNPPVFADVPSTESTTRFYRLNATPLVSSSVPPTGPYSVGITRRLMTDPSRRNRYGISTNGSFMISIWYPSVPQNGLSRDRYEETRVAEDIDWQTPEWMDRIPRFASFSFLDALFRPSVAGYPVVLYSHGHGGARYLNMERCEHLASHGYVVVAISHFDAFLELFSDGTLYKSPGAPSITATGLQDRVKDLVLTLDELERLNRTDAVLAGAIDTNRVAAIGFSWGAETVGEFSRQDKRCSAAIGLDSGGGTLTADTLRFGVQKPFLTMNRTDNSADEIYRLALRDAYFLQLSATVHNDFGGYDYFWSRGSTSAREASRTITAYVLSFLNKHLKGEDDHLLDAKSPLFPRVSTFRKK